MYYKVIKPLNENIFEDFGLSFSNKKDAEIQKKIISAIFGISIDKLEIVEVYKQWMM